MRPISRIKVLIIVFLLTGCNATTRIKVRSQNKLYFIEKEYQSALREAEKNDLSGFAGLSQPSHAVPSFSSHHSQRGLELTTEVLHHYPNPEIITSPAQEKTWYYHLMFMTIEGEYHEVLRVIEGLEKANRSTQPLSDIFIELKEYVYHLIQRNGPLPHNEHYLHLSPTLDLRGKIASTKDLAQKIKLLTLLLKESPIAHEKRVVQTIIYCYTDTTKLDEWLTLNKEHNDLGAIATAYTKKLHNRRHEDLLEFYNDPVDNYYPENIKKEWLIAIRDNLLTKERYYLAYRLDQTLQGYPSYERSKDTQAPIYTVLAQHQEQLINIYLYEELRDYRALAPAEKRQYKIERQITENTNQTDQPSATTTERYTTFRGRWGNVPNEDFWAMNPTHIITLKQTTNHTSTHTVTDPKEKLRSSLFLDTAPLDSTAYLSNLNLVRELIR